MSQPVQDISVTFFSLHTTGPTIPGTTTMADIKTVGIVGTGVIGASWAALFLSHGKKVLVADPGPESAEKLAKYIDGVWPALERIGMASGASPRNYEFVGANLGERLRECDFIQEVSVRPAATSCGAFFEDATTVADLT